MAGPVRSLREERQNLFLVPVRQLSRSPAEAHAVTVIARDHVQMEVEYGLPGALAVVLNEVESGCVKAFEEFRGYLLCDTGRTAEYVLGDL